MQTDDIALIILAAGTASRMSAPKMLLKAGEGHSLLTRAVELAWALDKEPLVISGCYHQEIVQELARYQAQYDKSYQLRYNPDFAEGLSSSLKLGMARVMGWGARAALVLLADQVAIQPHQLQTLIDTYLHLNTTGNEPFAVSAALRGEIRNPVLLSSQLLAEVNQLQGDMGAKVLLKGHSKEVHIVEWGEGVHFMDVDTRADYEQLCKLMAW